MMQALGLLIMMAGVVLGLYVGIWVCFIGGVIDLIGQIKAPAIETTVVAFGLAKIVFSGICGYASACLLLIPGAALFIQK